MKRIGIPMLLFTTCIALTAWPQAQPPSKHKIVTFDVKGAGTGNGQGTVGGVINRAGVIQGTYIDSNNVYHPFLRAPNGTITKINISGTWTFASSINAAGWITGYYAANNVYYSFLRAPDGTITKFSVRGAGKGNQQGTFAVNINPKGEEVAGEYEDANNGSHGFLRLTLPTEASTAWRCA